MTILKPDTRSGDILLEVALGNIAGYSALNKFGHATDVDAVATDLWDGADGATSTDVWVAPTAARIHAIVSSSTADKGTPTVSTGMRTVKIYGLTAWTDTDETVETITLNGTTAVNTVNAYVIIYRMLGKTFGTGRTNAGIVKATAATDNTITAMVAIGMGQTQMAIFGIPTGSRLVILHLHMDMLGLGATSGLGALIVEADPGNSLSGERIVREWNVLPSARYDAEIRPPLCIPGPAIVKMQCIADTVNQSATGTFDGIVAKTVNVEPGDSS